MKFKEISKSVLNNAETGINDGIGSANLYYNTNKSGTKQYGYMLGNLFANMEIITRHTIRKIKK